MVIAIGSYPIGRRFESHRRYQRRQAGLAERFCKRRRAGQPNTAPWSSGLRRRSFAEAAAGSCSKNFAPQAQAPGGDTGTKKENTAPWSSGLRRRSFAEAAAGSCSKNFAPQAQAPGGDTGTKKENTAPWSSGLRRRSFAEAAAGSCSKNFAPQAQAPGGDAGTKKENTAPWSSGLRHRPFTAVTRVRVPVGSPNWNYPNTTITEKWVRVVFLLPPKE